MVHDLPDYKRRSRSHGKPTSGLCLAATSLNALYWMVHSTKQPQDGPLETLAKSARMLLTNGNSVPDLGPCRMIGGRTFPEARDRQLVADGLKPPVSATMQGWLARSSEGCLNGSLAHAPPYTGPGMGGSCSARASVSYECCRYRARLYHNSRQYALVMVRLPRLALRHFKCWQQGSLARST
jgi:hypothetical protein